MLLVIFIALNAHLVVPAKSESKPEKFVLTEKDVKTIEEIILNNLIAEERIINVALSNIKEIADNNLRFNEDINLILNVSRNGVQNCASNAFLQHCLSYLKQIRNYLKEEEFETANKCLDANYLENLPIRLFDCASQQVQFFKNRITR